MTRLTLTAALAALAALPARADEVDFANDVMPVFTRHGCNAGACHGAAIGRGGFKLSLYGGDRDADHAAIVRQLAGRRVNLARPEESLVLLKPTGVIKHGGGVRFGDDGEAARLLRAWITQGAKNTARRTLSRVEVTKAARDLKVGRPVKLSVTAFYADGTERDVTRWAVFTPEDTSAVSIDGSAATARRRGRHIAAARYLTEVVPVEFVVPLTDAAVDLSGEPRHNFIDGEVLRTLTRLGLPVSPPADDATFLRRATLDLTGRLPKPARAEAFRRDADAGKRRRLVDELLKSDEFVEYWTYRLAKLLRVRSAGRGGAGQDKPGVLVYHDWLAKRLRRRGGYDDIARSLLTAEGDTHAYGPANFYRTAGSAGGQAEFVAEVFMGSRLRCANCHNHPLDRWTQDDYHGLAAVFAKVEAGRVVRPKPAGEVTHPATGEPAAPRLPGGRPLAKTADGRTAFADWLTHRDNPYFAKAIVNRLWRRMFGRGLVEPADDFRATNPATHPELLDRLAADFAEHGYDLRHTLRLIALSATYARSADALPLNKADDRFYSHARRRPLEPEVLADAISDVLGVPARYAGQPAGTRAVALPDPRTPSAALDILGRCGRDSSCESAPAAAGGLRKALHLFNGELLNGRVGDPSGRLGKLVAAGKTSAEIVEAFYVAALGRRPRAEERQFWARQFQTDRPARDQRDQLEDFVWGVLTCDEFVTNH